MLKATFRLAFEPQTAVETLRRRWQNGLPELGALVLRDCNAYARDDTGALIRSSAAASDLRGGKLIWRTGYARRVYYTGTPSRTRNPGACLRWCEKAKAARLPVWQQLAAQTLRGDEK